ncbi:M28 family peptidase [Daejeonella sp. H1SJ63]|uniref:M28 family peptidase n=1 Tax=Daejeonella sp. H1SJ63 TaxID=3034145 RepID=UPI0023EAF3E3|nr:M28 family peptidase [Daejeonella sp. H1SJ63]
MILRLLFIFAFLISNQVIAQSNDRKKLLSDLEKLSSDRFEGRKTGSYGNKLAAEYISSRFKEAGLESYNDGYKHSFSFKNSKDEQLNGTNLIGFIKGKSNDAIVITAHYDHLGIRNNEIFNGADDNASGVSVLIAISEYFSKHKPENTLIFIAFDAEEMGMQGAKSYIKKPLPSRSGIKLNVNLDMVSRNDRAELYAAGTYYNPVLKEFITEAGKNSGIKILFGHDIPGSGKDDWTLQSDHGVFAKENIPFIYFGVEDHAGYHQSSDKFSEVNPDFFHSASNAILRNVIEFDRNMDKIKTSSPKSLPTK